VDEPSGAFCSLVSVNKNYSQNGPAGARFDPMSAHNLTRDYQSPATPRLDDEDDDEREDATPKPTAAPVGALIQKKFLEQRKIFLWGAVTDETAKDLTEKLLYLETTGPGKEITFYMNTPGGSITAGMAVYDTIKLITSPVKIVVTGMAASMGSICHCEERSDEAIQMDRHGALRAPRDDNSVKGKGDHSRPIAEGAGVQVPAAEEGKAWERRN
jgi:hypothetical protein